MTLTLAAVAMRLAATRGRLGLRGSGSRVAGVAVAALLFAAPARSQPARSQPARAPSAASQAAAVRFAAETFPALADSFGVPGAVLAVVGPAGPVAMRGIGYADLAARTPADPRRTLFRVASVSKTVTATAVLALAERGRLDLHADVNGALRRVSVPSAFGAPVTAHALLTHTAGIDERIFGTGSRLPAPTLAAFVAATLPGRVAPPGALHSYSNHGYALLGVLAEDVTGRPFADVARALVFAPLGMASSTFRQPAPAALQGRLATGYTCPPGGTCTPLPYDAVAVSPAGALQTTAADLGRFATFHLSGAGGALSDSSRALMHAAQWRPHPALGGMGYGLFRGLVGRHEVLRHAGAWAGWSAQLVIVPDAGLAYAVAVNTDAGPFLDALLRRFAADVLGGPLPAPPLPASLAPLGRYAGTYRSARHVHHGPDKVALLLGFPAPDLVVRAPTDTALVLTAGGRTVRAFPLGAGAFVTPGLDPRRYAFDGAVSGRLHSDYGSWERIPWWATRGVGLWGFGGCALVFATAVAAWPWGALRRREAAASVRRTRALAAAAAVCFLAFGVGLAAAAVAMGPQGVVYALPAWVRALFVLPLAGAALGAAGAAAVGLLWRDGLGGRATRVHLAAVALAVALVVPLLALWGLLGVPR